MDSVTIGPNPVTEFVQTDRTITTSGNPRSFPKRQTMSCHNVTQTQSVPRCSQTDLFGEGGLGLSNHP